MSASTVVNFVDHQQIKTKLVCSACGAPGEGSCRCGASYVTPGERADAAVKANPEKSDRAIAEEIGVSSNTVRTARKKSGAQDCAPARRKGKDGKSYTAKRRTPPETFNAALDLRRQGKTQAEAAREVGGSVQNVKIAEADAQGYARGQSELLEQLGIDPKTLALSAQAKFEVAKRTMERQIGAALAARIRELDEEVRQRVLKEGKEYLKTLETMEAKASTNERFYRELINKHKPLFTVEQFKIILMCLHPDGVRTPEKLADAFRLFNSKKLQLTGEKS